MDFELPVGYPVTENTAIDDDNGMHVDIDALSSRAKVLLEEDTMKDPTENDRYSDFNADDLIFGIARLNRAEYAHRSQPNDNRLINDVHSARIGNTGGINSLTQYKKNNIADDRHNNGCDISENIFDNNNKLNFEDDKTEDFKLDVPPAKRVSLTRRKKKKSKRKRIHGFTVCKLKNIKHIENSLRKYLLVSNILLRLYKIEI